MRVGYARVSSASQNLSRQIEALLAAGVDEKDIFREKESGASEGRAGLDRMLGFLRKGDTVVVCSFDRLARSTKDLLRLAETFEEKGVDLVSLSERIDTSTPQGRLFFTVSAAFAEFERAIMRERQAEGIAIAKAEGRMVGRPRVPKEKLDVACALYLEGSYKMSEIEKIAGCSYGSIYREINRRGIGHRSRPAANAADVVS